MTIMRDFAAAWLDRIGGVLGWSFIVLVCFILVAPGLVLIPMSLTTTTYLSFPTDGLSLRWYQELLLDDHWREGLANSIVVAIGSTTLAIATGAPAAVAVHRFGSRFLSGEAAAALPLVMPTVVLGAGLYHWYLDMGWVGTKTGLIAAHAFLGAPMVLLTTLATLRRVNPELEQAALTMGANNWVVLFTVTLPLALPGLIAGGLFAFIISFDEIALAFFLTDAGMKTLPKILFDEASYTLRPTLAAASTILIVASALAAAFALFSARKSGSSARQDR
ncbi:ABC transporter permease [Pseudorhodoplanes sp.]|uniref:ABC transporter permease n=1 Tax=Pseudorhodoplanes sp. TaxID=1934341 RepID=UPI003D0E775E